MSSFGQQVLPVAISILILIFISILRGYSTTIAAFTATMPIMVPLAFWIVYAGEGGDNLVMTHFLQTMIVGLLATLVALIAMLWATHSGWGVAATLVACYGGWAVSIALYQLISRFISASG